MKAFWHRLLLFLRIRNDFDWAGPELGPEVPHPYMQHPTLRCCEHCGGGKLNAIHREPFNARRTCEVLGIAVNDPVVACIARGYRVSDPLTPAAAAELSRLVGRERGIEQRSEIGAPDSPQRALWLDSLHNDILNAVDTKPVRYIEREHR